MIKVMNVLICALAATYMFMSFPHDATCAGVDIPAGCIKKMLDINYGRMKDAYNLVLYLFAFECFVLVSSAVYNCFLRSRVLLGEKFCATVAGFRLVVDVGVIIIVALLIVGEAIIMHEVKSFKVVDENGNSTMLVRDINSEEE